MLLAAPPSQLLLIAYALFMSYLVAWRKELMNCPLLTKWYYILFALYTVSYCFYVFVQVISLRIMRVHFYLKNRRENTVSIIKNMKKAKFWEKVYIFCMLFVYMDYFLRSKFV